MTARPERPGRQVDDVEPPVGPDEDAGDARKVAVAQERRERGRGWCRARGRRSRGSGRTDGADDDGVEADGADATPRSSRGAVSQTAATARTTVATSAAASGPTIRSAPPRRRAAYRDRSGRARSNSPSLCGGIRQSSATDRISPAMPFVVGTGASRRGAIHLAGSSNHLGHRAARRLPAGSVAVSTSAASSRRRRVACERLRIEPTLPGLVRRNARDLGVVVAVVVAEDQDRAGGRLERGEALFDEVARRHFDRRIGALRRWRRKGDRSPGAASRRTRRRRRSSIAALLTIPCSHARSDRLASY